MEPARANSFDHLTGNALDERVGRAYELAFLKDFYDREQVESLEFRWSEPQGQLILSGLPHSRLQLRLGMHGAVGSTETVTRLLANDRLIAAFAVPEEAHDYSIMLEPSLWSGDRLVLTLDSTPFQPGGADPRVLGVALDRVVLSGPRAALPTFFPTAFLLAGVAAFLYLSLRRAGLEGRLAAVVTLAWGVAVFGLLLSPLRSWTAVYAPGLFLAVALAYPVLVLTLWAAARLFRRAGCVPDAPTWRWLALLFLLVFLLRFGGAMSPRYSGHDAGFHANRLEFIERGAIFFEHYSLESGMQADPYPGTLYLLLAPFATIFTDGQSLLAFFLAWMASSEVLIFWALIRPAASAQTGRWAVLLYQAFPINLASFWQATYTNLFASWVALLVVLAIILVLRGRLTTSWFFWVPLFSILFLAHLGFLILWIPAVLLWCAVLYFKRRARDRRHPEAEKQGALNLRVERLRPLFSAGLVSAMLAVGLYYSDFYSFFGSLGSPLSEVATADGASRLVRTLAELRVWWTWGVVADYAGVGVFLAAVGLAIALARGKRNPALLFLLIVGGVVAFFWAISMSTFYFTRYMLFLLPAVAWGCAEALAWLDRRWPGRLVARLLLFYIMGITLVMWVGLCLFGLRPPHVL